MQLLKFASLVILTVALGNTSLAVGLGRHDVNVREMVPIKFSQKQSSKKVLAKNTDILVDSNRSRDDVHSVTVFRKCVQRKRLQLDKDTPTKTHHHSSE